MSLLFSRNPLVVNPELATRIGLNEAILLQQLNYWLREPSSGIEHGGFRWVYNTLDGWRKQFPFMSESTIKRGFTSLKRMGIVRIEQLSQNKHDKTNYYSIINESPYLSDEVNLTSSNRSNCTDGTGQSELMEKVNLNQPNRSNCTDVTETTTEITTEITAEIKNPCPVRAEPDENSSDPAERVLAHFNRVTKSSYRDSKTTMGYIRGRLAEPVYSAEDLILVTDYATAKWLNDAKMCDYLRPKTLFGPENFPEYHQKALKWSEAGRPECINGVWLRAGSNFRQPSRAENAVPDGFRGSL